MDENTHMKLLEHAKEGLRNLFFSKLRSMLALLGVLVGTASVVAMVLGGEIATNEALKQFKSLGTDLLAVSINASSDENHESTGKAENLTLEQALAVAKTDKNISAIAPYTQLFHPVFYNGNPLNATLLGVTDSFADIVKITLQQGRFVSMFDQYTFYCVIGHGIYEVIKQFTAQDPLGQPLQIGKNIFVIVGVANTWAENNFVYADIDNSILVPILASTVMSKYATINNIIMRLTPEANITQVTQHVENYLNEVLAEKQTQFRSAKELINKMQKQSNILTVFLGLVGGISLIVGGIGVMNIMLVSVIERRREIGIRLAVGAKPKDIAALFLMEAIMLSLVGGVAGVLLGMLIAYVIALIWHWEFTLFLFPPVIGFLVSVFVGIFFGFYPAVQAAKLNPIEALRSE